MLRHPLTNVALPVGAWSKGGKIAALRAVFDARPFAALFGR